MSKECNKNSEKRGRLASFLRDSVSLPSDGFIGSFTVEMRGRELLFMQGCRGIVKYSKEEIILAAKGFFVSIKGNGLICTSYYGGTVTVEGKVNNIDFFDGEEGK